MLEMFFGFFVESKSESFFVDCAADNLVGVGVGVADVVGFVALKADCLPTTCFDLFDEIKFSSVVDGLFKFVVDGLFKFVVDGLFKFVVDGLFKFVEAFAAGNFLRSLLEVFNDDVALDAVVGVGVTDFEHCK